MTHLRYGKICSHAGLGSASVTRFRNKFGMTDVLKFGMTDVLKSGITILILILSIFVLSCENTISSVNDDSFEAEQKTEVSSPYLLISVTDSISGNLLTPQPSIAARPITSLITSSLFSDISLTGTSTTGGTVSASASSFAELSQRKIYLEEGSWTFSLVAYLGKTAASSGGKYTATQSITIVDGVNPLTMTLYPAPASQTTEEERQGRWQTSLEFPADTIDKIKVYLLTYADFAAGTTDTASNLIYQFVKGTDYDATGTQTITTSESTLQMGSYVIYIEYFTKLTLQNSSIVQEELLNTWAELLRISPGAKSEGTITLPEADPVYTIQYDLGGPDYSWLASPTEAIPLSYTRKSGGTTGTITLPTAASFVDRGPLYTFEGWYTDANFAAGTGPVTSFNATSTGNKHFYAKWDEPVYDVYIKAGADDSTADGSKAHPFSSVSLAAYQTFDDITATNADGTYKSTIHILSDYTGSNKITVPWGNGAASLNEMCVNFVGEKNEVTNADVTLEVNVPSNQSFIYIENSQKMKFSHINITSSKTYSDPNGYGCLSSTSGTVLRFEDSSITGYTANGCTGINVEGTAYLKNCEISGNSAIDADSTSNIWGCAVNVSTGTLHLGQGVVIKNNSILKNDGSGDAESESYNLYIGNYSGSTLIFHELEIDEALTGSEIWVKLAQEPGTFTAGYSACDTANPSTYFHSDSGMEVRLLSGEARLAAVMNLYVATNGHDDSSANGTSANPYASIAYAISKITQQNNNQIDATIYVTGNIPCNTTIVDGASGGTQLLANSLTIEGLGTDAALNGNESGTVLDSRISVPLILKNLTIKNGKTDYRGGGLYIDGTTVEINNCIIENNSAVIQGGGVYLTNGAQLTMNGAASVIRGNAVTTYLDSTVTVSTNKCGGGVYINSGTTKFIMNAGTIEGNGAYSGGGVYVRGTFEMNGDPASTKIQSNKRIVVSGSSPADLATLLGSTVQMTANVEVGIPGTFNMNGGKITSSLSEGQNGAGVCLYASHHNGDENGTATFNMAGGEISGLNISQNAAVYLAAFPDSGSGESFSTVFNMSGGKITGNTSTNNTGNSTSYGGAGVFAGRFSTFNMTGGEISNNHARIKAGGVYLETVTGTGITAPTITLGQSSSASTILIKDNTVGTPAAAGNLWLNDGQTINVAGALNTASEIGITKTVSASVFTTGFASHNSGTSPDAVFVSDADCGITASIQAGSVGEAKLDISSYNSIVYTPADYHFTFTASKSSVALGSAANVTIIPTVTRSEPSGLTTQLYYKATDHKLYLNPAFTQPAGGDNEVTWSASLWFLTDEEQPNLSHGSGADANKFSIAALSFENNYTLKAVATYMGYAHDAEFTIRCVYVSGIPEGFVSVTGTTFDGTSPVSGSPVFKSGRNLGEIKNLIASDHEVTQGEYTTYCKFGGTQPDASVGLGDNYPAYFVSWYDAIVYCNLKTINDPSLDLFDCAYSLDGEKDPRKWDGIQVTSGKYCGPSSDNTAWNGISFDPQAKGWHLTTEVEWEYLARGGSLSGTQTSYSGSNNINDVAWYNLNSNIKTHEVKTKQPNSLNIYDMSGNVYEICWDRYISSISVGTGATGPTSGSSRIWRGGSWDSENNYCILTNRMYSSSPYERANKMGFRVVRTVE